MAINSGSRTFGYRTRARKLKAHTQWKKEWARYAKSRILSEKKNKGDPPTLLEN